MSPLVLLGALAIVGACFVLWWGLSGARPSAASSNLMAGLDVRAPGDLRDADLSRSGRERAIDPLTEWAARGARRLTPRGWLDGLATRLVQAGNPHGLTLSEVLATKVGLGLLGGLVGGLRLLGGVTPVDLLLLAALTVGGFFLPDALLSTAVSHRRDAIRLSVADTVDQLTICVEAGLGLDAAMARVAAANEGPLSDEFRRTLQDVRAGVPRSRALEEMAERVDVADLRHLVLAIVQAEKHGIPVADTLRIQAADMRLRRSQYAEEKAMKLPVKLIFPTLLCIMPALFVVILGPAVIRIFDTLGG